MICLGWSVLVHNHGCFEGRLFLLLALKCFSLVPGRWRDEITGADYAKRKIIWPNYSNHFHPSQNVLYQGKIRTSSSLTPEVFRLVIEAWWDFVDLCKFCILFKWLTITVTSITFCWLFMATEYGNVRDESDEWELLLSVINMKVLERLIANYSDEHEPLIRHIC